MCMEDCLNFKFYLKKKKKKHFPDRRELHSKLPFLQSPFII